MSVTKKKILLALWCLASLFWADLMAHAFKFKRAIDTYGAYYQLTNNINDGIATGYDRKVYMEYGPRLEEAGRNFAMFVLTGLVLPCFILRIGSNFINNRNKPAQRKR